MQHLHPPQQRGAQPSAREIEELRARQRMQSRHQHQHANQQHQQLHEQQLRSQGGATGNQDEEGDDRVRKLSVVKRHQQFQQQYQQQQREIAASRTTKLPNFGFERIHHHHHHQHVTSTYDAPSPVPHETHTMFNAFDYGNSPEAFSFAQQQQHRADHTTSHDDQQMTLDGDDEKSLWRRRFASDATHVRRSPKLGRVALWDANCPLGYGGENNQFSHLQPHNQQQQH